MKLIVYFIFIIGISIIPKTYTQNSSQKGLGCSGCAFWGSSPLICGEIVPAACLPDECTSLLYYWIRSDPDTLEIIDYTETYSRREYIDDLDSVGKPVFLYYGQYTIEDWMTHIAGNTKDGGQKARCEMQNLKAYLDQFKNIKGLILPNLVPDPSTKCIPDMTANFKVYIDEMRKTFPDYGIGLEIIGSKLIDCSANPPACLDYKCLDPCIDFYILDLYYFNNCTKSMENGGASPISGKDGRTLEQLVCAAKEASIPQSKIYFGYRPGATPIVEDNVCNEINSKMCRRKTNEGFCADNTQSYYDKGVFAKKNGAGFMITNLDILDDPNGKCLCGTPYPAFYDILAGFKGDPVPKPCPLLDKC